MYLLAKNIECLQYILNARSVSPIAVFFLQYMNAMSKGKPPPGQRHHLVRGSTFNGTENGKVYGSRVRTVLFKGIIFCIFMPHLRSKI